MYSTLLQAIDNRLRDNVGNKGKINNGKAMLTVTIKLVSVRCKNMAPICYMKLLGLSTTKVGEGIPCFSLLL